MNGLAIVATGLVTAVGFNAASTCAALRAGIRGVKTANLYEPRSGKPLSAAKVDLPQWSETVEKLADLVAPAIDECLRAAEPAVAPQDIPILLGSAGRDRPHRFAGLEERLLEEVEYRLGLAHHPHSRLLPRAQVSAAYALQYAGAMFARTDIRTVVVAAADSLLRQNVVTALFEQRRIMSDDNSNGFFPGEAGSAVLVVPLGRFPGCQMEVLGLGFGMEPAPIHGTEPCRAEGLTAALREAVAAASVPFEQIALRITDLNGEHYKFKEATFAIARMEKTRAHQPFVLWHPIEYLGEIGAAIGPLALAVAHRAGEREYAPGDLALLHFSNDDGERAAIVVRLRGTGGS